MAHGWLKALEVFTWPGLCHVCNVWILPSKSWPAVLALWIWKKWRNHFGPVTFRDSLWHTLAFFDYPSRVLLSFFLRVFTTISEFNPNVPNVPVSCMSQDGVRDAAVSCNSTVRSSAYMICVYLRGAHCTCISDFGKSPHFLGAFFWLGFVVLAASCEVITCLNRGTADFTPPYRQKSLDGVVLRDSLQKSSWPNRLFASLRTIDRKGSPRLMFSNPREPVYIPKAQRNRK